MAQWVFCLRRWGAMARQVDSAVMLSAAKHLPARRDRPFAAAQGDMDEAQGDTGSIG